MLYLQLVIMQLIGGLLLCVLVGLAAADFECYQNAMVECDLKGKPNVKDTDFCKTQPRIAKCYFLAAVECKTGFEDVARRALTIADAVCKEGTPVNDALKNDKQCNFETVKQDSDECTEDMNEEMKKIKPGLNPAIERSRIICRYMDSVKYCMYRKIVTQCSELVQDALYAVIDSSAKVLRKVCTLLPPE